MHQAAGTTQIKCALFSAIFIFAVATITKNKVSCFVGGNYRVVASRQLVAQDSGPRVVYRRLVAQDSGPRVVYRQLVAQDSGPRVVYRQLVAQDFEPRVVYKQQVAQHSEPRVVWQATTNHCSCTWCENYRRT